ncbi:transposase [Streptomyces sp. Wh19]|uniref:Transposase n=1 Tax=Streptomyces sanglieri TaxID=193460 RepID=A0ABW2X7M5_9ACTN|nr:transposase [Streptomyces sp. Wh19]MDV9197169.1 transposase [Streptomyces sp. Wh19]
MLTDVQGARIEPLLPDRTPRRGGRWRDHRQVIDAIAWKYRTGSPWMDLPAEFGSWKGAYSRLRNWALDGTRERVFTALLAQADANEDLSWVVSEVPEFPVTRPDSRLFDPDETYARLRAHSPVSPVRCPAGMDVWLVSRYEDIRSVLTDPRLSSRGAGSMHMLPSYDGRDPSRGSMIQLDGEEHARLRRLLIGEFTMRRMEALRPSVQRITDRHIDAMLAGSSADLVRDFALPIPSLVICELLGVPYDDHGAFQRDSEVLIGFDADEATRGHCHVG